MALEQPNTLETPDISIPDILMKPPYKRRRSPIIVTIADPKTTTIDIQKMMELGMDVIRFRMSYCTPGDQMRLLGKVDKAAATLSKKHAINDWPVTTCVELQACTTKTGFLEGGAQCITVKKDSRVVLTNHIEEFDKCTASRIFVDDPYIATDINFGVSIAIGHNEIELLCKKIIDERSIGCLVTKTGKLKNLSLVFLREAERKSKPVLTRKDLQTVKFALTYQIDMIIVNYAREMETIQKVKEYIGKTVKRPLLLAGICTLEGLENLDDLIMESDGIVFSRELLSIELEESIRYKLSLIQKWACAKCQQAGKPFFISGGVFKRALSCGQFFDNETTEVTYALLDGVTGFILNECPNVENVFEVIRTLNELCRNVEPLTFSKADFWRILEGMAIPVNAAESCAIACAVAAIQCNARVIVIPTVSGQAAKTLMWLRPACIVITVSSSKVTTRRLKSYRCIVPMLFKGGSYKNWYLSVEARVHFAVEHAVKVGWLKFNDTYVTLQRGTEDSAFCDAVRIWSVTTKKKATVECPDDTELKRDAKGKNPKH